jgi:1-phosphofructokinase family hexose kinase
MLLAVTPNPAVDRTLVIPGCRPGGVHRAREVLVAAGGKGMNVARAACTLGQPLRVCAPLAGFSGQLVAHLAQAEGFAGRWSWHEGSETRTCTLVVDPEGEDATALNEPGESLPAAAWDAFAAAVQAAAAEAELVTLSGSLPAGVAAEALTALLDALAAEGRRCIVDTSGAALRAALQSTPYGIKVNGSELGAALGTPVDDVAQAGAALRDLRSRGIALPAVSLGAQGALAASEAGICWARPPALQIVSSIGSGDSLLAGLATGLLRGDDLPQALRLGVACGAADALTIGGGLIDAGEVQRLQEASSIEWL